MLIYAVYIWCICNSWSCFSSNGLAVGSQPLEWWRIGYTPVDDVITYLPASLWILKVQSNIWNIWCKGRISGKASVVNLASISCANLSGYLWFWRRGWRRGDFLTVGVGSALCCNKSQTNFRVIDISMVTVFGVAAGWVEVLTETQCQGLGGLLIGIVLMCSAVCWVKPPFAPVNTVIHHNPMRNHVTQGRLLLSSVQPQVCLLLSPETCKIIFDHLQFPGQNKTSTERFMV